MERIEDFRRRGQARLGAAMLGGAVLLAAVGEGLTADETDGYVIAERFRRLNRDSTWQKAKEVRLDFPTYHPQGMTIVGDRFFLSSVEVLDREKGKGVGHLFEVDFQGKLLRRARLGEGPMYHPGGIDFDGKRIWVPVAEYRPDSRTVVYAVDPQSLEVERVFDFSDHLGALVGDAMGQKLIGVSWGSRRYYRWDLHQDGQLMMTAPARQENGSHYVDYQDGQFLKGTACALFSGISRLGDDGAGSFALGGVELVDIWQMRATHQLPVMLRTARGESLLRNPFAVESRGKGLRFYFVPEDDTSMLHVYDVE
jgi:hypothetical protein